MKIRRCSSCTGIAPNSTVGLTTRYTYTNDLLVAQQNPDGVVTAYAHNNRRQVISTTVGVGTALAQTTTFGHYSLGRVMTTTVGAALCAKYSQS